MIIYLYSVSIAWLSFCFLITFKASVDSPSAYLTGDVSINCGSKETSAANNGREWAGDTHPKIATSLQIKGSSTISSAISQCISADPIAYKNARISRSMFSYTFHTEPGQKFIRLHFNPTTYKGFKRYKDLFTVEAASFTLLHNFSASLTAGALGVKSFVKEFCINVQENQQLEMVFSSQSQDTYAFINGIEIKSVPSPHSYLHGVGIGQSTALEMVHREKVKQGTLLVPHDDSSDVFGMWETHPEEKPNRSNKIKWKIPVSVGFRYLVRLHFSHLGIDMTETVDVMLKVLGKEMNADIVVERDKNGILGYRDYLVLMTGCKEEKRVLLIYLQPKDRVPLGERPLVGFEIFKISNHDNSLASPNPMPLEPSSPLWTIQSLFLILVHRNAIPTVIALVCSIVYKLREIREANEEKEENKPSARAQRFCRRFSLEEIQLATRNFSQELLIGKGGFGNVYKGIIDKEEEKTVAIKRLKPSSNQGATEFLTEIETLSELKHLNLVSLIGYCNEPGEMILVYEYLSGGTLSEHLYNLAKGKNYLSSLTWKQCLGICVGAGRGLDYLHTGCAIIHGDVKASNILLDDNLMAKLSDFGTARHENGSDLQTEVSSLIKGTLGYIDPYYLSSCVLTRKSDIYAFGVVLLEVLCGRPVFDPRLAQDEHILTEWARDEISKGKFDQIVSASLRQEISPGSLESFLKISQSCMHDEPEKRPTMAQVVLQLESVIAQHESMRTLVKNETSKDAKNTSVAIAVGEQALATGRNENRQQMSKMAIAEPSSVGEKALATGRNENRQHMNIMAITEHSAVATGHGNGQNMNIMAIAEPSAVATGQNENMSKMAIAEASSVRTAEAHGPLEKSHMKTEMPTRGTQRKIVAGKEKDRETDRKPTIKFEWDMWANAGNTTVFMGTRPK
ncbi:probable receptor-like protein kinase At5g38990 isoform X2 [Henckelia pumila]|uniref:probable receptor-like protein kinase At5g38990 isoform X2 n=1 Tax=Henckelia pumila TaxID=405737 RepID=UPI003C6E93F6